MTHVRAEAEVRLTGDVLDEHLLDLPDPLWDLLPAAVYVCARDGQILRYNRRAIDLWGRAPKLLDPLDRFCGSYRLYRLDGSLLPHTQCPMADVLRTGIAVRDQEVVIERLDGTRVITLASIDPLKNRAGTIVGAVNCFLDVTERRRNGGEFRKNRDELEGAAEDALRESEARLSAELDATRQLQDISAQLIHEDGIEALYEKLVDAAALIMRSDYASMQMLYPERGTGGELRLLAFRGFNPAAAKFWEWVRADSESTCGVALRTRERVVVADVETCDFMAGTDDLETYLQTGIHAVQTTPLVSRSGRLLGMISTHWRRPYDSPESDLRRLDVLARQAADLIERSQAEERLRESGKQIRVLMREINHRSKNLLLVVQAIARRTASANGVSPEFEKSFSARLKGLAASQDLLVRDNSVGVAISDLVASQLGHHSDLIGGRIAIEGPPLEVGPAAAQSIGMAMHELSTNAVKYGALKSRTGRVDIRWNVKGNSRSERYLEMSWTEKDGPPIVPPQRSGFGSTVIERLLMQSLGGKVVVEYPSEGLRWRFRAPLSNIEP